MIYYFDTAGALIALILGATIKFVRKQPYLLSDYFLIFFLLMELALSIAASYLEGLSINNHWLYHLNGILSFIIFSLFFYSFITNKNLVILCFVIFGIAYPLIVRYLQPLDTFPSYPYAIVSFFIVCFTFLSFWQILAKLPTNQILQLKEFWFLTGTLAYFACTFLVFISYNYLSTESPDNVGILWRVHNIFLFISCLLFLKSLTSRRWIPESS